MSIDRVCIDCGATFTVPVANSKSRRCKACQNERNRRKQAEWNEVRRRYRAAGRKDDSSPTQRINFGMAHTLAETAQMMGLSRQRVQQIENIALRKLRRKMEEMRLHSVEEVLG